MIELTQAVKDLLSPEIQSEAINDLRERCLKLVAKSRSDMSESYSTWDENYNTYRATKYNDEEDKQAEEKNEPTKMVMPLVYAQVETFVSFAFLLYTQNKNFFQLGFRGAEDEIMRPFAEDSLQRDLNYNKFRVILIKWLRNLGIYNLAIFKNTWKVAEHYVPDQDPTTDGFTGYTFGRDAEYKKVTTYRGNDITTLSPYSFFPDTRYPLSEFQKGEFCADEQEVSKATLKQLASENKVVGIKHLRSMNKEQYGARGHSDSTRLPTANKHFNGKNKESDLPCEVILNVQIDIIPNDFEIDGRHPLGTFTHPVRHIVTIANDKRIIAITPHGYLHNQFTYSLAEMSPDQMQIIGDAMPFMLEKFQDVMTWLVNSRVTSVSRTLEHNFIYDPAIIDPEHIQSRSPAIPVKKNSARGGIANYFQSLPQVDATASHAADMQTFNQLSQMVTGVNDNAMGQYNSGRRSASESRVVTQGAASRQSSTDSSIYEDGLMPLGSQMLSNQRQGFDRAEFDAIYGLGMNQIDEGEKNRVWLAFKSNPEHLARQTDLFLFDGTLPSEKNFLAQSLQEILVALVANPEFVQLFNLDPVAIFNEIQELRGVRKLSRFTNNPKPPLTDASQVIDTGTQGATTQGIQSPDELLSIIDGQGVS